MRRTTRQNSSMRIFQVWALLALAAMLLAPALHSAEAPPSINTGAATDAKRAQTAHQDAQRQLEALLASREEMTRIMQQSELATFRTRIIELQKQIAVARVTLDRAFLVGAWKSAKVKRSANDFVNRIQGLEILCTMAVAIVAGYDYPTNKIPASAADATTKLYNELARFTADVQHLNTTI